MQIFISLLVNLLETTCDFGFIVQYNHLSHIKISKSFIALKFCPMYLNLVLKSIYIKVKSVNMGSQEEAKNWPSSTSGLCSESHLF